MGIGDSAGLEAAKLYKPVVDKLSNQADQALVDLKFYGERLDKRALEFAQQLDNLMALFNESIYQVYFIRKSSEKHVSMILSEFNRSRELVNETNEKLAEALKLGFFICGCFIQILVIVVYLLMTIGLSGNKRTTKRSVFEEIIENMLKNATCSYIISIIILLINILLYSSCYNSEVFSLISASSTLCFWIFFSFQLTIDLISRLILNRPLFVLILSLFIAFILDTFLVLAYNLSFFGPYTFF